MLRLLLLFAMTFQWTLMSFGGIYSFWAIAEDELVVACPVESTPSTGAKGEAFGLCRDQFRTVLAMSQMVPGPRVNGAGVLGFRLSGTPGMVAVLLAMVTPGLILIPLLSGWQQRTRRRWWAAAFFHGAGIGVVGVLAHFAAALAAPQPNRPWFDSAAIAAVVAICFVLSARFRLPPLAVIVTGIVLGGLLF